MKKWYLVILVIGIILSIMSCDALKPKKAIPPAAISEIYAMAGARTWLYGEYVEVKDVQDRKDFCYIMIYIKSLPEEPTTLNEALDKAKVFTRTFVESAVKILKRYDINQDVSVWAQLPLKEGGVQVLGHARYEAKKGIYHDFEQLESDKKD
jgi:uncharacterized RmlC-like cupin family protein